MAMTVDPTYTSQLSNYTLGASPDAQALLSRIGLSTKPATSPRVSVKSSKGDQDSKRKQEQDQEDRQQSGDQADQQEARQMQEQMYPTEGGGPGDASQTDPVYSANTDSSPFSVGDNPDTWGSDPFGTGSSGDPFDTLGGGDPNAGGDPGTDPFGGGDPGTGGGDGTGDGGVPDISGGGGDAGGGGGGGGEYYGGEIEPKEYARGGPVKRKIKTKKPKGGKKATDENAREETPPEPSDPPTQITAPKAPPQMGIPDDATAEPPPMAPPGPVGPDVAAAAADEVGAIPEEPQHLATGGQPVTAPVTSNPNTASSNYISGPGAPAPMAPFGHLPPLANAFDEIKTKGLDALTALIQRLRALGMIIDPRLLGGGGGGRGGGGGGGKPQGDNQNKPTRKDDSPPNERPREGYPGVEQTPWDQSEPGSKSSKQSEDLLEPPAKSGGSEIINIKREPGKAKDGDQSQNTEADPYKDQPSDNEQMTEEGRGKGDYGDFSSKENTSPWDEQGFQDNNYIDNSYQNSDQGSNLDDLANLYGPELMGGAGGDGGDSSGDIGNTSDW